MYVQEELIQPDDKVLFVLKKNDLPLKLTSLFFMTAGVGIVPAVVVWVEGELGVRILLVFTYVFALVSTILTAWQYQKTELVLTKRRLLLSQGLFKIKRYNIPITEIEAVGEVILSKGARIPLSFIFKRKSIGKMVEVFNRVHKRPGLQDDIRALWDEKTLGKLPGSAGSGEDVLSGPEEIVFTYRKSKPGKLIEISIWVFLISLDILVAWNNSYSFFKLLGFSLFGLLLIVGLYFRLRMFKDFIVLTNKNLIIRASFVDPGTKFVSKKTIPLTSIREISYLDGLHIVLKNGEQLTVSMEAKPQELRRLVDLIAGLNKRS